LVERSGALSIGSGSPRRRAGPRSLSLGLLYQLYIWPLVLANTLVGYLTGRIATLTLGADAAWALALRRWSRANMVLGFYRCRVEGIEHAVAGSVLASTHQGAFDVNVLSAILPRPYRFVARNEVLRVPAVGAALLAGGHVLIARGGGRQNDGALARAAERLRRGERIVFFPEGTRSRDGSVGGYRPGAFRLAAQAGRPLVPVVISGTRDAFASGSPMIVPTRIAVEFLPPRPVSEADARSEAFREAVRAEAAERLDRLRRDTGPRF